MTEPGAYPFGDEITSTANDREKFATYTRDAYTGLDYADQRYFASTYGRFNTADPYFKSAHLRDPQSFNRYTYVSSDPVNRADASGLCDVAVAGITMAQGTNSSFDAYAQNDISVYPYSTTANLPVTGAISGVFQVLGQAVLTSSSTYAVAMGLVNAAQDGQPINVTTFSGGAGAFTAAVNLLNNVGGSWVTKMINNITYVSPGAFGSLYDNGKANIYTGGLNLLDMAVSATALISNPLMASRSFAAPQCGHDFGCIASYFSNFSSAAGGACSDPGSISQTTPLPTPPSPMYLEDQYWWLRPTGPASDDPN